MADSNFRIIKEDNQYKFLVEIWDETNNFSCKWDLNKKEDIKTAIQNTIDVLDTMEETYETDMFSEPKKELIQILEKYE